MSIKVEPIKPSIGAIVHVARDELCNADVVQSVKDALEKHSVLVFPQMHLTDDEQLAFTDRLGTRFSYARNFPNSDRPMEDVYKVSFDKLLGGKEFVQGTFYWHIDGVMVDTPISKATLLTARKLSQKGGQTEFASLYAAYDALPDAEKKELEGLQAIHSLAPSMKLIFDNPTSEELAKWNNTASKRPIVWTHKSGRKSLVLGQSLDRIVDMPVPDGRARIIRLLEWAARPEFRYTHQWQEGDLVLWDNTAVMHRVIPYEETSGRTMHRTTIEGLEMIA